MIKKLKQKWVAALRSGKYKQCNGLLCRLNDRGRATGHCCLGVLLEVAKKEGYDIKKQKADYNTTNRQYVFAGEKHDTMTGGLSESFRTRIKLDGLDESELISMNDGGKSFDEIADFIQKEKNL